MTAHVLSGLLKKRKELTSQLAEHQRGMEQATATLCALDATIRIYKPDHDMPVQGSARRTKKRNRYFEVGEAPQLLRDYFRDTPSGATPSTSDIVLALAVVKGFDYESMPHDKQQVFRKSVMKALKRAIVSGWLVERHRDQGVIHWRLDELGHKGY